VDEDVLRLLVGLQAGILVVFLLLARQRGEYFAVLLRSHLRVADGHQVVHGTLATDILLDVLVLLLDPALLQLLVIVEILEVALVLAGEHMAHL